MESSGCIRETPRIILNNFLTLKTLHLFVGLFFLYIFVSNNNNMDFNKLVIQSYTDAELDNVVKNPTDYLMGHAQVCRAEIARRQSLNI